MNNTIKLSVNSKNSGKRLDILTESINNYTHRFKKMIELGQVKLNGKTFTSPALKIKYKDQISINIIETITKDILPKEIKLNIIFEDKDIVVLNKPKGMVVHPGAGNFKILSQCLAV